MMMSTELKNSDWELKTRIFGISRRDLDIFLRMIVGGTVIIKLTNTRIVLIDKSNERRKGEFRLLDMTEQLDPNHPVGKAFLTGVNSMLQVAVKDGKLHSTKMLKNGNYAHIKSNTRPYYAKKVPSEDVHWEFAFLGDTAQLSERRTTVIQNIIDDVWEYELVSHQDRKIPLPKKLSQHYLDETVKNFIIKSGVEEMFIVYTDKAMGLFCTKNDEELMSISYIKPVNVED